MSRSKPDFSSVERRRIRARLLRWYALHKRDLPWRRAPTPYRVWVAEMMLQQTQVATALPYYRRFLRRFPSIKALAAADEADVLKAWEGLGYYSRARNLRKAARKIRREYGGRFPRTREALLSLPGVGPYSAGAILSIAMGRDEPAVDGNVTRVFARLLQYSQDVTRMPARKHLWQVAEGLLPRGRAGDFNQALMELGAGVCRPRNPRCGECPLSGHCRAYREGLQTSLPRKPRARPVPHYDVGVGVVWKAGRILIARRPSEGLLGGLWEFPGGKIRPGERAAECVRREVREELNVKVTVDAHMVTAKHAYSHFKVTLHFYECRYRAGRPKALGCAAWKWVRPQELSQYAFPAGTVPALRLLTPV